MKLTVIYHMYKDDRWLKESLESLFNQTDKDFELVLIDDNASESFGDILKDYNIKHKNIKLIKFMENYGRSFSYNFALNKIKGEYIYFAETRCMFNEGFVAKIKEITKKSNYDWISFANSELDIIPGRDLVEIKNDDSTNDLYNIVNTKLTIKNKVFNKKFLTQNKIEFYQFKSYFSLFLFDVMEKAQTGVALNDILVEWKRELSDGFEYNLYNILEAAEILKERLNKSNCSETKKDAFSTWFPVLILYEFLSKMYKSYDNDKIVSKSIKNASDLIDKLDVSYKSNKLLNLLHSKLMYNYIKNFKPSYSHVKKIFTEN